MDERIKARRARMEAAATIYFDEVNLLYHVSACPVTKQRPMAAGPAYTAGLRGMTAHSCVAASKAR